MEKQPHICLGAENIFYFFCEFILFVINKRFKPRKNYIFNFNHCKKCRTFEPFEKGARGEE